ncbi:SDR family NAD(P)-dependent oxidoreductase [Haladaptatus sp. GCM10025707]|uniref:SDR family NAD(P)-dependent oxidoreductase n=1 Tax=unclassified Haladaptatus TaxID=2622732 RepID=UPI0023E80C9B|nr:MULTISPECIES: SDR family NAD(P)-dependent oxidoreductase [unclassified Haladaptatus]
MAISGGQQVVVITGANEGIGFHLAAALLEAGYRVACLDVEGAQFQSLVESHPSHARFEECDVTVDDDVTHAVERIIDEWGGIDILVNNAAVFNFAPFDEQTLADTRREFEVNYFGYLRTIHAVLPHMQARNSGIIHNVSSGAGLVGHPSLTGYAATKGAIEAFVRSLRLELQRTNVSCTVMHPPLANTRSGATLGYPESFLSDPAYVGRKLAAKIESTDPVITADWKTKLGLTLSKRFPTMVRRGTARFVE